MLPVRQACVRRIELSICDLIWIIPKLMSEGEGESTEKITFLCNRSSCGFEEIG
jgi:hypothetical protein